MVKGVEANLKSYRGKHSFEYLFQLLLVVPLYALLGMPPLLLPLNKLLLGMPSLTTYPPCDIDFHTPSDTSSISIHSCGAAFLLSYLSWHCT
ncbi:hypothetical protein RDI58_010902 [Solanum bulbocastanum]|uniref:Uncharacterized protein n=1 Tax=Solanum bulbocastanum TaxID=147425 RepID=A0AAN8TUL4_SOLBU